jgi:hypothetical protein
MIRARDWLAWCAWIADQSSEAVAAEETWENTSLDSDEKR